MYIYISPFIDKGKEEKVIVNKCTLISGRTLVSQSRDRTRKQATYVQPCESFVSRKLQRRSRGQPKGNFKR